MIGCLVLSSSNMADSGVQVVELLLEHGADPLAKNKSGRTALAQAPGAISICISLRGLTEIRAGETR